MEILCTMYCIIRENTSVEFISAHKVFSSYSLIFGQGLDFCVTVIQYEKRLLRILMKSRKRKKIIIGLHKGS